MQFFREFFPEVILDHDKCSAEEKMPVAIMNQNSFSKVGGTIFEGQFLITYSAMKLPDKEYPESTNSWHSSINSSAEFALWTCESALGCLTERIPTRERRMFLIDLRSWFVMLGPKKAEEGCL
jgi:hypothetical protein